MDISKWFYRPHYTTPELDKKIEDVEKALGFKLFIWQKTYIEYGVFRQYGETPEILRDWEAAQNAVNDMLSKYAPGGYMGKIIYPLLTPLKERLEAGERTPDLYNAIVEATR